MLLCVYKAEAKLIKYNFHSEIDATVAENLKQHIWCPNNFFFFNKLRMIAC